MNTQYIKKPLSYFLYRLIFSVFGLGILHGLMNVQNGFFFSLILLIFNLPVLYISAHMLATDDLKSYSETKSYPAKGAVMGFLYFIPCIIVIALFGLISKGFFPGCNVGYRFVFLPYLAIIGASSQTEASITYFLPPILDIAALTLGYIAGMNRFSIFRIFREKVVYNKKEQK